MKKIFLICALLLSASVNVHAATLGPLYPAPGGHDFVNTGGISGANGTAIWGFSNFDPASFDTLYYGLDQLSYGTAGAGLDGTLTPFTFSGVAGQTATWGGTTTWYDDVTLVATASTTRLQLTITGLGATPWITDLSSVGLNDIGTFGDLGAVADNSSGLDFVLQWTIEADTGSGWEAINTVQQSSAHEGDTRSSIATGFYYTAPSAVPIPAAGWLFGSALLGLGIVNRKKA